MTRWRTTLERERTAARENPWIWKSFGFLGVMHVLQGLSRTVEDPGWLSFALLGMGTLALAFAGWSFRQVRVARRPSRGTDRA